MKVIGLTGGIGTGKSTVSAYLKEHGFAVVDADRIAHEVVEPGKPLLTELAAAFGGELIRQDGTLDRKGLAAIVFPDPEKRRQLDRIMHGRILEEIRRQVGVHQEAGVCRGVIMDVPLLFETGLDKDCHQVWVVTADQEIRIARVCARDGMRPEEVKARMANQMDDAEKCRRADKLIDNSGNRGELFAQLSALIDAAEKQEA